MRFCGYLESSSEGLLGKIKSQGALTDEIREGLEKAIKSFKAQFKTGAAEAA